MTAMFLLFLGILGVLMKWVAWRAVGHRSDRCFIWSPVVAPCSIRSAGEVPGLGALVGRTLLRLGVAALAYWVYWVLVRQFELRGVILSYLAVPILLFVSQFLAGMVSLLWWPTGLRFRELHHRPFLARGVDDFWGRRWNLWFSDWFRQIILLRMRRRRIQAVVVAFAVSGVMHEWVLSVPLWWLTGRCLLGSMMGYFLIQAAGLLVERRIPKRNEATRLVFAWLVVFGPVPLLTHEGLLRVLYLWPTL